MWRERVRKQACRRDAGRRGGNAESPAGSWEGPVHGGDALWLCDNFLFPLPSFLLPLSFISLSLRLFLSLSLCVSLSLFLSLSVYLSLSFSLSPENVLLFNYRHKYSRLLGSS